MVELMETVFEVKISLGSIPAQQQRVSLALKEPVEAAQKHVQKQTAVNMDETGWYEMAKDFWLWVCTTPEVSVFRIFDSRSGSGAKTLLGENYSGTVGTDRFGGYAWIDLLPIANCVGRTSSAISRHWSSAGMNPNGGANVTLPPQSIFWLLAPFP